MSRLATEAIAAKLLPEGRELDRTPTAGKVASKNFIGEAVNIGDENRHATLAPIDDVVVSALFEDAVQNILKFGVILGAGSKSVGSTGICRGSGMPIVNDGAWVLIRVGAISGVRFVDGQG